MKELIITALCVVTDNISSEDTELLHNIIKDRGIGFFTLSYNELTKTPPEEILLNKGIATSTTLFITSHRLSGEILSENNLACAAYLQKNTSSDLFFIPYGFMEPSQTDITYFDRIIRRKLGIPWIITTTKNLIIRETTESDVDRFWEIYKDETILANTEGLYPTIEDEKEYIRNYIKNCYAYYGFGIWTVILKETGEIIGRAGISLREGLSYPELGFVTDKAYRNKGLTLEALLAVMAFCKEETGYDKIHAIVRCTNTPSLNLLKKLKLSVTDNITLDDIPHYLMTGELKDNPLPYTELVSLTGDDVSKVYELISNTGKNEGLGELFSYETDIESYRNLIENNPGFALKYKDKIIACLLTYTQNDDSESVYQKAGLTKEEIQKCAILEYAVVSKEYRGYGLQKYLMKTAVSYLSKDYSIFLATVHPENAPSYNSMIACGFTKYCQTSLYGGLTRLIMKKTI
ncbi:MAG: GNAT family N-acetyltransferase [Lachnospiraceae bacterium]|nr:GNAT family N-acetyltransferase [Lachnospiraceae bacterium]